MATIAPVQILGQNRNDGIGSILSQGVNVLQSALQSAVQNGRAMADNQLRQEQDFLAERRDLRLLSERKGNELQRRFEATRAFDEGVLRDRRNFSEDVRRDDRNFGQKVLTDDRNFGLQLGNQALAGQRLSMDGRRLELEDRKLDILDERYNQQDDDAITAAANATIPWAFGGVLQDKPGEESPGNTLYGNGLPQPGDLLRTEPRKPEGPTPEQTQSHLSSLSDERLMVMADDMKRASRGLKRTPEDAILVLEELGRRERAAKAAAPPKNQGTYAGGTLAPDVSKVSSRNILGQ
jgi:hypothetical protein